MKDKDKIIGIDFQGWPEYKMSWKEILMALGAKETESGDLIISKNTLDFEKYPRTVEDDGMGYGVNEQYIISAAEDYIFVETETKDIQLWLKAKYKKYDTFKSNDIQYIIDGIKEEDGNILYQCKILREKNCKSQMYTWFKEEEINI